MALPIKFRKSPETIKSFNFTDTLRGRAYEIMYASRAPTNAAVFESYITGRDEQEQISSITEFSTQTFTVGNTGSNSDFWVTGVELMLETGGLSTAIVRVSIQGTTAGKPDGNDIAVFQETAPDYGTDFNAFRRLTFDAPVLLSSSTQYSIVIRLISLASGSLSIGQDGSSPTYAGGQKGTSTDSGDTWTMDATTDILFKIIGTTKNPLILTSVAPSNQGSVKIEKFNIPNYTSIVDLDIDGEMGTNVIIQGDALLSMTITGVNNGVGDSILGYIDAELFHFDGTTETTMASSTSNSITGTGSNTFTINFNISANTTFKKGDFVRLNMKAFYSTGTSNGDVELSFNWSDLELQVPFKII